MWGMDGDSTAHSSRAMAEISQHLLMSYFSSAMDGQGAVAVGMKERISVPLEFRSR